MLRRRETRPSPRPVPCGPLLGCADAEAEVGIYSSAGPPAPALVGLTYDGGAFTAFTDLALALLPLACS